MTLLLDTHVLVWFREGGKELGRRARRLLDKAAGRGELAVSAVSFYEIAFLAGKGKVRLRLPIDQWRQRGAEAGIEEIAVDGGIALRAAQLSGLSGDPFDRMIAATADERGIALMTADTITLAWQSRLKRFDARE